MDNPVQQQIQVLGDIEQPNLDSFLAFPTAYGYLDQRRRYFPLQPIRGSVRFLAGANRLLIAG